MDKKAVDKKKNKKLKKALLKKKDQKAKQNLKQKVKQKVKQSVKQSTNINIKIGDTGKKKKPKRRKKTGGEPMRLQRRPHLPPNPLIGAITYTPPPGYSAPSDFARALPRPPPPLPPPLAPLPAPVEGPAGELGATVGAESAPLRPYAPAGISPLLPAARREEIVAPYNFFEPPASLQSSSGYATSIGTSGGALSPRRALGRSAAAAAATRPAPTYNPQPSEASIAQAEDRTWKNRLSASGFSGIDPYSGPGGRRDGSAGVRSSALSEGSAKSEQEDEGKSAGGSLYSAKSAPPVMSVGWASGIMGSVNQDVFRQGQALDGVRTGLAPANSGGASGGLIGGGSTMIGDQGTPLETPSYEGQKLYAATYANTRGKFAGRAGKPKLKSGEGGAGGARKGAGRKPKATPRPASPTPSSSSSLGARIRRGLASMGSSGSKSPRPNIPQQKGTTLRVPVPRDESNPQGGRGRKKVLKIRQPQGGD